MIYRVPDFLWFCSFPNPNPSPLGSLSQSSCVSPVKLSDRRGGGGGRGVKSYGHRHNSILFVVAVNPLLNIWYNCTLFLLFMLRRSEKIHFVYDKNLGIFLATFALSRAECFALYLLRWKSCHVICFQFRLFILTCKEWRKNYAVQEYTQCPKNSVDGGLSIECSGQGVSEVFL